MPLGENSFPAAPKNTDSGTQTGPEGPVGPYPCGPASVALCHAQDLRRDEHQQLGLFLVARLALEQVAVARDVAEERCRGPVVLVFVSVASADHPCLPVVHPNPGVYLPAGEGEHEDATT